jgi:hypothetical protein
MEQKFSEKEVEALAFIASIPDLVSSCMSDGKVRDAITVDGFLLALAARLGNCRNARSSGDHNVGALSEIAPEHIVPLQSLIGGGFITADHVWAYKDARKAIKLVKELAARLQ